MKENENQEWIEKVTEILNGYKGLKLRAQQLKFEIEHYIPAASGNDVIDSMTFNKPDGAGSSHVHSSIITDKTANTAISYEDNTDALNAKYKEELEDDLRIVNMEMLRLEYYISLLGGNFSNVLRLLYINGLTYTKAASELKLSISGLKKARKIGIVKLASMYRAISA